MVKFRRRATGHFVTLIRNGIHLITVEPRFNEVAGDRPNLFVKSRVRYIENLDITNLRGNDQNVRYIEVIVKGAGSPFEHAHSGCES